MFCSRGVDRPRRDGTTDLSRNWVKAWDTNYGKRSLDGHLNSLQQALGSEIGKWMKKKSQRGGLVYMLSCSE